MKTLLSFLITFIFISTSNAQWVPLNSPTQNHLFCTQVIDSLTTFVGGAGGKVYKTLDAGETWFDLSPQLSGELHSMYFYDNNYGWVAGQHGVVARTTNGGSSWEINSVFSSSVDNFVEAMYFYNRDTGYVAGGAVYPPFNDRELYIYKTFDGGQTWNQLLYLFGADILSMSFINANLGYVAGTNGFVFKTTNGGSSWQDFSIPTGYWLRAIYFIDAENGVVMGQNGAGWRTSNGGLNWNLINTNVSTLIESVFFYDKDNGWLVADGGKASYTNDGGNSWNSSNLPTLNFLRAVHFKGQSGFIAGHNGTIFKSNLVRSIKVLMPNGGEILTQNSYYPIKWEKTLIDRVNIDFSVDDGLSWGVIDTNITGTIYNWLVPNISSVQCRIRISDAYDESFFDISDSSFVITLIPVELISFVGYVNGNNIVIEWSTASETNNYGFEIQYIDSEEEPVENKWEKIGFVYGNGTTSNISNYSYKIESNNYIGKSLKFRLKQIDFDGSFEYSPDVNVYIDIPLTYSLYQNYPNPFNPVCKIKFSLPEFNHVILKIFNSLGQEISEIVNDNLNAGIYEYEFKGDNLSSGVYFYKLITNDYVSIKKMNLIK